MTAAVIACECVGLSVVVVSECVCDSEQVFHDEALEQSLFFGTMCNCCSCTNVTASRPRRIGPQPRLGVHSHMTMRIFRAGYHQRAKVFQIPRMLCITLRGFTWTQITLNFFPSQQTSSSQLLPLTRPTNPSVPGSQSSLGARAPLIAATITFASGDNCITCCHSRRRSKKKYQSGPVSFFSHVFIAEFLGLCWWQCTSRAFRAWRICTPGILSFLPRILCRRRRVRGRIRRWRIRVQGS